MNKLLKALKAREVLSDPFQRAMLPTLQYEKMQQEALWEEYPNLSVLACEPVRIILYCPLCGKRHLDEGEWATRQHRTHLCTDDVSGEGCGHLWRPCRHPTVGIKALALDVDAGT